MFGQKLLLSIRLECTIISNMSVWGKAMPATEIYERALEIVEELKG